MPGMLYPQYSPSNHKPASSLQEDVISVLDIHPLLQSRTALQAPLVPSRHKACRPSQAQVEWILKSKQELLQVNSPGGNHRKVGCDHDNGESENDLADMVHDFIENGSCGQDHYEASDSDTPASVLPKLCEGLQVVTSTITSSERDIASIATTIILGASELDLFCPNNGTDCNGNCVLHLAVKHLRISGYNASICRSKWQNNGKVPGGEYEFVDICLEGDHLLKEQVIIDLDFRSQFEIARPSQQYQAALRSLPHVFVGKLTKLEKILQIMSEAAKCSLKQNSMHIPPWRTLAYMYAKWLSPYERKEIDLRNQQLQHVQGVNRRNSYQASGSTEESQCKEQLRRLKAALKVDVEKGLVLKPILNGRRNITRIRGTW